MSNLQAPIPEGVFEADALELLARLPDGCLDLVYIDPPFCTGSRQRLDSIAASESGDQKRTDFAGRYATYEVKSSFSYRDDMPFEEYLVWLEKVVIEIRRALKDTGSMYLHLDWRASAHARLICDRIFGTECFLNEIIWAYDFGGRARDKWARKHDTILWYAKGKIHTFNRDAIERIPYMAPKLVGAEKAARGKLPTDCYSADTDILTKRGWVPFPDLRGDDLVASVSKEHEIVYIKPSKLHAYVYQGEMYEISTKTVDLLVTPNHRLYVKPKHGKEFEFIEARELDVHSASPNQYYLLPNKLSWQGVGQAEMEVPATDYKRPSMAKILPRFDMGDWCEFMGWCLSEGCTVTFKDRAEVVLSQRKSEGRIRIRELLEKMGIHYWTTPNTFVIANKQLRDYLKPFGYAVDKYIPRDLLELSVPMLERLYEGLLLGDGHQRKSRGGTEWIYLTTSPRLAGDVQELIIKLGFNSNISVSISSNPKWKPKLTVSRRTSAESSVWPAKHVRKVSYDGMVYCCTVEPHHTLIVRRNGKASVCGNCWWLTVEPTGSLDRTGYPTQKPTKLLERIIIASSNSGDLVADFFGGSGTTAAVAQSLGRRFLTCDSNPAAVKVIKTRLEAQSAGRRFKPSRAQAKDAAKVSAD